jgi:hypothetical protein
MSPLPETLTRFRFELEDAIDRDHARGHRRTRRLAGGAVLSTVIGAAIVSGVLSVLPGDGLSIVERAAAALKPRGDSILHTKIVYRRDYRDGTFDSSVLEQWEQSRRPYARRGISRVNSACVTGCEGGRIIGGRRIIANESASSGFDEGSSTTSLYDPVTNTIYVRPPKGAGFLRSAPRFCAIEGVATRRQLQNCAYPFFAPGPRPGTIRVTSLTRLNDEKPFRYRVGAEIVSTKEARHISGHLAIKGPTPDYHRQGILDLLNRDDVVVSGRVRVGGREAIRLGWNRGRSVYLVDADTYDPISLRETNKRGTSTTLFLVYERLPLNARTRALLSLRAQHPNARIERDPRAVRAAGLRHSLHG